MQFGHAGNAMVYAWLQSVTLAAVATVAAQYLFTQTSEVFFVLPPQRVAGFAQP